MIALFIIGILVFTGKLIHFACKAAWGITKGVLFVIGIPALLMVLFVAGLVSLAIPLLVLALAAAFLLPVKFACCTLLMPSAVGWALSQSWLGRS